MLKKKSHYKILLQCPFSTKYMSNSWYRKACPIHCKWKRCKDKNSLQGAKMLDLIKKFKVAFIIKDLRKTVFIELKNGMIIF